jgi:tetratricopeptide (TPR) repeat protein
MAPLAAEESRMSRIVLRWRARSALVAAKLAPLVRSFGLRLETGARAARATSAELTRAPRARLLETLSKHKEQRGGGVAKRQGEVERSRLRGDRHGEAIELNRLAVAYRREGELKAAHVCLMRALTISTEIADPHCQGLSLNNLGLTYAKQGLFEQAIPHYTRAAEIFHSQGEAQGEGEALANLGCLYRVQGREEDARRLLGEASRKLPEESRAHRRVTGLLDAADSAQ